MARIVDAEQERRATASPSCINKYLSHARGLLEYAWRCGRADRNVLEGFTLEDAVRHTPPPSLTIEEAKRLVAARPRGTAAQRRDRLVVLLLYGCGLRTQELCSLNVEHVSVELRELHVLTAKGDKPRVVPVPDGAFVEFLAYLHERGGKRGALFRTVTKGKRISNKEAGALVRAVAHRAALPDTLTPRTDRRRISAIQTLSDA